MSSTPEPDGTTPEPGEGAPAPKGAPVDPFSALMASATTLHEIHVSYVEAGFTEAQSVYLVGVMLAVHVQRTPPST
jgi:hypothetical protein